MFVNRTRELEALEGFWAEKKSHLLILYGRRRVGKTELVKHFIHKKNGLYFLADKRTELEQLKELSSIVANHFNDELLELRPFGSWLEFFIYLSKNKQKRLVLAIDEYPYLVESNTATSSIFQKGWDEYLKQSNVLLILLGSSISVMESETLIHKSPLYGRRSGQLLLNSFSFTESVKFHPHLSFKEIMDIYSITGGVPLYLLEFNSDKDLKTNIQEKIFTKTAFLHNEIEFLLKEELREPKNYFAVLRSLSLGKTKFGEIINETGLEKNTLTKYLSTLEKLGFIRRELPVTEQNIDKSRKGIYVIVDNFARFWFKYCYPNRSLLELGSYSRVHKQIHDNWTIFCSKTYEDVCRELIVDLQTKIFDFEKIGRWWDKDHEIDIVAFSESQNKILFAEVKYSSKQVGINILEDLREKSKQVIWSNDRRQEYYLLASVNGFTPALIKEAKSRGVFLIEQDKLI
jgi:AAA+ ATPase superfamily predicted ATPase